MTPIFYILMRSDMKSMNPGKGMAQAAHAATAFEHKYWTTIGAVAVKQKGMKAEKHNALHDMYKEWSGSTKQGFGTKIVLDIGDEININDLLYEAEHSGAPILFDKILDPTYPVRDGRVTHYLPVVTCAYIFTDKEMWHPSPSWPLYK